MPKIEVINEKAVITLTLDEAAIILDTKTMKFETAVPASQSIYLELFKMWIWLLSGTELANKVAELLVLSYYGEQAGLTGEKPNLRQNNKRVVRVSNPNIGLVDDLFKKVLGGK
jgi:hypothetical protein